MCEFRQHYQILNSKSNIISILVINNLTKAISLIHLARLITFPPSSSRGAVKAGLWNVVSLEYCIAEYGKCSSALLYNDVLKRKDFPQLTQKC